MNLHKFNEIKYKVINKKGKVLETFRGKVSADRFKKEYLKKFNEEVEVERI